MAAALGPLALAAAVLRPASGTGIAGAALGGSLDGFALPAFALAAAIAAALLLELVFDVGRLRRIKRHATLLGDVPVRGARIGTSPTVATPTAIGYFHPAVVVPDDFRARVDDGEWDAVIAHECAHLARRDDWAKALQSALLRACWWSPGLWLLGRALDLERELASDERAARETGPRRYAACLLRLATHRGNDALAPAFFGRRSHVAIRVERLLRPSGHAAPLVRATALGALTAAGLAAVAFAVTAIPATSRLEPVAAARPIEVAVTQAYRFERRLTVVPRVAVHAAVQATEPARVFAPAAPRRAEIARVAAVAVPAPVHVRPHAPVEAAVLPHPRASAPIRRQVRRAPPIRAVAAISPAAVVPSTDLLAYAPPHVRCSTCFGPLRSPDGAYATVTSGSSSAPPPPAAFTPGGAVPSVTITAITPDDPSGATELKPGMLWIRIPRAAGP